MLKVDLQKTWFHITKLKESKILEARYNLVDWNFDWQLDREDFVFKELIQDLFTGNRCKYLVA